jgi:hypothetical protein
LAIRSARFELTVGFEASALTTASGFASGSSGGVPKAASYDQPDWYDNASVSNRVTTVGYATGTLAAGATANIDLQALTGPDGSTVTLATLICGLIRITGTTGLLRIGNHATNAHQLEFGSDSSTWTIRPTGPGLAFGDPAGTGSAVSAADRYVKVENTHGSASVAYEAYFGGRT